MNNFSDKRRKKASNLKWRGKKRVRPGIDTVTVIDHSGRKLCGLRLVAPKPHGGFRQAVEYEGLVAEDTEVYTGNSHEDAMLWEARRLLLDLADKQGSPGTGTH